MLIIDMPMPKNCGECPLLYMEIVKCTVTGRDCTEYGAERPSWCPIKGERVRCGECIHRYVDGENVRFNVCELNHNKVQADDWFCADGERRSDGEG